MLRNEILQLGDFTEAGRTEMLRYVACDGIWWLGRLRDMKLRWSLANTC
jgi:hypothetical protein